MKAREFVGQDGLLQPPPGYNERGDAKCGQLPIMIIPASASGPQQMISIWSPSAEELAALNAGASVRLSVVGGGHPPVSLDVVQAELLP